MRRGELLSGRRLLSLVKGDSGLVFARAFFPLLTSLIGTRGSEGRCTRGR